MARGSRRVQRLRGGLQRVRLGLDLRLVLALHRGLEVGQRQQLPSSAERPPDEPVEPRRIDLTPGPVGRTEDPVRLYLREMGRVSLLTREGEITLAKRIEEGKDEVTGATLSTALAIDKIRLLRDDLRRELIPIKDVVDYNEEESTEEKEAELIAKFFAEETELWGKVIREANVTVQ